MIFFDISKLKMRMALLVTLTGVLAPHLATAQSTTQTTLSNGGTITNLSGKQGSNAMYKITVPAGASNLRFVTSGSSGSGDVDIFAKFNALPTVASYDAKSDGPTTAETISFASPKAGTYYLLMYGDWGTYSGVSLAAKYDTATTTTTTTTTTSTAIQLSNGVAINNIGGAYGSTKSYQISVPAGASNLRFVTSGSTGSGDVDIFAKFSMPVSVTSYDAKSDGPTTSEKITISAPQVGTYNLLLYGDWGTYSGVSLVASYDIASTTATPTPTPTPTPQSCQLSASTVVPAIATQAAWDTRFNAQYSSSTLPSLNGDANNYAWHGHYWLRSYVSMAKTYGDTKYLDYALSTIDFWFAHSDTAQGWGGTLDPANRMLATGMIAQAISIFSYAVWDDPRFVAYRAKADSYIALLEPMLHTYDYQWVDNAPLPGSPSFYRYATCNGLCGTGSLVMYNQGATMAKALLMIDRVKRLKGQTPDAGYLHKADAAAAYFKTFVRLNGTAYDWDYGGARTNSGMEDTNHAHVDLSLVVWARKFGIGGLNDTDMQRLAGTMQKILSGAGSNNVSLLVDGTGLPTSNWDRVSVGYDWIELADYDPTLFDKTVRVFNTYMSVPEGSRFFLGWAEIMRKKSCTPL